MTTQPTESPTSGGTQPSPENRAGVKSTRTPPARSSRMKAAIQAALPPGSAGKAARSVWWQCRKGLYPVALGGGLYALADSLHQAGDTSLWSVPLGALAVGVGGLTLKKVRGWIGKSLWRLPWYGGALAVAAAWTTTAVAVGPTGDTMQFLLLAGGSLAAAPWWWVNRPRSGLFYAPPVAAIEAAPIVEEAPEPEPEPEPEPHEHQIAWSNLAGSRGKQEPLADSLLVDPEELFDHEGEPNGWAWTIDGVKKHEYEKMRGSIGRIRLTFDRDDVFNLVQLERHRSGRIGYGRVIIMERNPLRRMISWNGPVLERLTGRVPFAVYPDGSGWAYYLLFRPDWGTPHDLLAGAYGSGKSTALRLIMAESICFGSAVFLFDPHGGGSFTEAKPKVTKTFLDAREIFAGMRGVQAAHRERLKILREVGEKNMGPDFGHPILHIVLDEAAHEDVLAIPEISKILRAVVKEGRKLWIKLTLALQDPSAEAFEDNRQLRTQLLGGNVLAYRLGDERASRMINPAGLDIAPHQIPKSFDLEGNEATSGLGYILGATQREMVSRTIHATEASFIENVPEANQLDPRTRAAFERGYQRGLTEWDETHEEDLDDDDYFEEDDAPAGEQGNVTPITAPSFAKGKALALFRERGRLKPVDLVEAQICPVSTAYRVCGELASEGHVSKAPDGFYVLKAS